MPRRTSAAVSPTAFYTGTVWRRGGLSHPAFRTRAGDAMWAALRGPRWVVEGLGGPSLDAMLLARHRLIDALLERAIAKGRVGQVVEVAAGLSPRGWRFTQRHGDALRYVETDLPDMAERKQSLLRDSGLLGPRHEVRTLDAFDPDAVAALADDLDPDVGTAVISEGLLNYFPTADVLTLWGSIGAVLPRFPHGLYLADLHLDRPEDHDAVARAAALLISGFVRGGVHPHFSSEQAALAALRDAGLGDPSLGTAELLVPSSFGGDPATGIDRNLIVHART